MDTENIMLDHVHLLDTGAPFPFVLQIDEGYRRGQGLKTKDGKYVSIIGVSNVCAIEKTSNYKLQEGEEVIPLIGFVINSKKDAEILSEHFKEFAEKIPG